MIDLYKFYSGIETVYSCQNSNCNYLTNSDNTLLGEICPECGSHMEAV